MSTIIPDITRRISRRRFIKTSVAGILGTGALLTVLRITMSAPDADPARPYPEMPAEKPAIPPYKKKTHFFDEQQYNLVATLAALIVPTDDDPGATEANVVDYIDHMVANEKEKQVVYTNGMKWLNKASKQRYGSKQGFLGLTTEKQIELLQIIDKAWSMRSRPVSGFAQRVDRRIDKIVDDWFGMGEHSRFFSVVRQDVIAGYFSNPISWKVVGYYSPPQPLGYPDFSEPPSLSNYTGSVRLVDNSSCNTCHFEGKKHGRGGLINHTCTSCHRPHSPWPYDKAAFHLEDHLGSAFSNPDCKKDGFVKTPKLAILEPITH